MSDKTPAQGRAGTNQDLLEWLEVVESEIRVEILRGHRLRQLRDQKDRIDGAPTSAE
jgi:hypothetical protein